MSRIATTVQVAPAIRAFTDIDLYKLTMGQFVWRYHPREHVRYSFINRHTDRVPIADLVNEGDLRAQIAQAQALRPTDEELAFLRETGLFDDEYLAFLAAIELPEPRVRRVGTQYEITVDGEWQTAIYWETMILAIVNELINRRYMGQALDHDMDVRAQGIHRLYDKLNTLHAYGVTGVVDFGTRRRFDAHWHWVVADTLATQCPDVVVGTSNVYLARETGLAPKGTFAHEMPMAYAAMAERDGEGAIRASHGQFLDRWFEMYGQTLAIALTDTFGADFFLADMGPERLQQWRGLRHDSGDPFDWSDDVLRAYRQAGVDPTAKLMLYSDGLDSDLITRLHRTYGGSANVGFGWGTNLTNDMGYPATSMVMKLTEINGRKTVKLSDNLAKATGPAEKIKQYARIFGHPGAGYTPTVY